MEELEWSPSTEHLEDILKNPKVQLPQIIKLSEDFIPASGSHEIGKGQLIVLHGVKSIEYLIAKNKEGTDFNIPIDCPYKVKLTLPPGKEKIFETILDLAKAEPLPRFVEVTKVSSESKVVKGERLKVVIVEKSGGNPSVIHFRNSAGKHVKVAVSEDISFSLAANDSSELFISKLAEKSHELPLHAKFVANSETPKTHIDAGILTFSKAASIDIVIATSKQKKKELALAFPLNDISFKFDINSNLKLANDESYRSLCSSASSADVEKVCQFLYKNVLNDISSRYITKYKEILKELGETVVNDDASDDDKKDTPSPPLEKKSSLPENTLTIDNEQKELVKKQQKEIQKQVKAEKAWLKAEKKKEKKERKEREKEEKKKRKETLSRSNTTEVSEPPEVIENVDEDLYITPHSPIPQTSQEEQHISNEHYQQQQPQWALHLMKNVKKLRDRTKSVGLKSKKRGKLKKEDIKFSSSDNLDDASPTSPDTSSYYSAMDSDDPFSDSLYETLPCEMAYESLDLIAQAKRSFAPVATENSGDSGFDEIDQAKITAWRDSMAPPPLPGNHPVQKPTPGSDDLYEVAVDSSADGNQMNTAWQAFYNIVEQSTKEISSWDMEDVANCLADLKLGAHRQIFADSQIDGQLLIDLDESVLRDLGLSPFEARKLRKFTFGWRPDIMRPPNYPQLQGFESEDPSQWSEEDVIKHLTTIEMTDFVKFCRENQVNGDLLKDICVDDAIMGTIITTKDKKLKTVKIKNYAIDKWRPKKKGEGNYISVSNLQKQMSNSSQNSPVLKKSNSSTLNQRLSTNFNGKENASPNLRRSESSPYSARRNSPLASKKKAGEAPLVARMKQQFEEKNN